MSEHQYYEFLAIDRRLTPEQMRDLRACSTRATITPTSFVNHYNFGDLKASPEDWMRRYFDAHLYFANWGTRVVMLRLSRKAIDTRLVKRYCGGGSASARSAGQHVVLTFQIDPEEGNDEGDCAGLLSSIASIRDELASGDHRALYLGWLLRLQHKEIKDTLPEPPCPPGLGKLSPALEAFADFLYIDRALIDAAAEGSAAIAVPSLAAMKRLVRALSSRDKERLLVRVAQGEGREVGARLLRSLPSTSPKRRTARTGGHLQERSEEIADSLAFTLPPRRQDRASRDSGRRSVAEISATAARVYQEIAREGGRSIEQLARALGVGTRELALPVKKLLATHAIKTQGHERATKYSVAR